LYNYIIYVVGTEFKQSMLKHAINHYAQLC